MTGVKASVVFKFNPMNHHYATVIAYTVIFLTVVSHSFSKSTGSAFLHCVTTPFTLNIQDEEVRLSTNDRFYLGECHPDAATCYTHIIQTNHTCTWRLTDLVSDLNCGRHIDWVDGNISLHQINRGCNSLNANDTLDPILSGKIVTLDGQGIEKVTVTLVVPGGSNLEYITSYDGHFNFGHVFPQGGLIIPTRNDLHKNGVSTLDLVKMQKHLLGTAPFTSPYQYIAADINNNLLLSAIDLIEIRKIILGVYTEFPNSPS
jgi:hypothetical protein